MVIIRDETASLGKANDSSDSLANPALETGNRDAPSTHADSTENKPEVAAPKGPPLPPPPIDHGLLCWLQVVGSFGMWLNCWGIVNTFGVYQTYYQVINLSKKTPSQISWIGSVQTFLLMAVGVLAGPLYDAGYFSALNLVGNGLVVFGLMMVSLCDEYWQLMLAQGIVVGLGCGCLFVPSTGILPQYFVKRRAAAIAIAASGSGVGGLIYPIVFRELQVKIGFGWAVRVTAFISLFFGVLANVTSRNKLPAGRMRKLIDLDIMNEVPLVMVGVGGFFIFLGLYAPVIYIGVYALEKDITGENMAFYLVAILQAGSIVGRLGLGLLADKTGALNMFVMSTLGCGILGLCWIAIENTAGLIVFAVLYGIFYGTLLAMAPAAIMSLLKGNMKQFGTHFGTILLLDSIGVLIGNPIAGAILRSDAGFVGLQAFSACMVILAGIILVVARVLAVGWGVAKV